MLEGFWGSKFGQYTGHEPNKYELKMYAMVDSHYFILQIWKFTWGNNLMVHIKSIKVHVAMRLAEPLLNRDRNITTDNYFSSVLLGKELLQKRTTLVGTFRKKKKEIPPVLSTRQGQFKVQYLPFQKMECLLHICRKKTSMF